MPFDKETTYSPVSSAEDGRMASQESEESLLNGHTRRREAKSHSIWTFAIAFNVLFFLAGCSSLALTIFWKREVDENTCARKTSVWSPALDVVRYEEVEFQNLFDEPSIYRGPPTAEREQAWQDLWEHNTVSIPADKLHLLNKSISIQPFRRIPESRGGGFSGTPDVFHQLHCLDRIRQYTWLQSGNYGDSPNTAAGEQKSLPLVPIPSVWEGMTDTGNRMHVDHCIESLRKTLMCHGDVTPLLIAADESSWLGAKPDFNVHQKCRNWDAIREWTTENWVQW
ncbi:hypothetical protein MMC12_002445 [Toensbergia leucococca]|nr:hypothetical protein [Toensbergia leucococca]